jgi:hypothetical protein
MARKISKHYLFASLKELFGDYLFAGLAFSLTGNFLAIYYWIFSRTTTWEVFWQSNNDFYNIASLLLTGLMAVFFGIATSLFLLVLRKKKHLATSGSTLTGTLVGIISAGCPVCGAWILPLLGIAGSLAAFPLQGLEIKLISLFLLGWSIKTSAQLLTGQCKLAKKKLISIDRKFITLRLEKTTLPQLKPAAVLLGAILLIYLLPQLPASFKLNFARQKQASQARQTTKLSPGQLFRQVNPPQGYTINISYGKLGPQLLKSGAIDLEKFKQVYNRARQPLTPEQLKILTQGSNQKITISQKNAYFLLNFFWAAGLANNNPILQEGPISKYGKNKIGSFASTGGWTIGTKKATQIFSRTSLIKLTPEQQKRLEEVAYNSYRPCCGNPTGFPDCNHGMALLGVLELMAANNATVNQMFEAAKYFNAFWFPQQYLQLAAYFKQTEGKNFSEVDPKLIVSSNYSSAQGYTRVKRYLAQNNLAPTLPNRGSGCGV